MDISFMILLSDNNIYSKISRFLDAKTIQSLDSIINTEKSIRMFYEYKGRLGHLRPIILNSFNESRNIGMILLDLIKSYKIKFCHGCAKILINEYLCDSCKYNLIPCDYCKYYYTVHELRFYEGGKSICKFCYNTTINNNFFNYANIIEKIIPFLEQYTNILLTKCDICYKNISISLKYLTRKKLMNKNPNNEKIVDPAKYLLSNGNLGREYYDPMEYVDSINIIDSKKHIDIHDYSVSRSRMPAGEIFINNKKNLYIDYYTTYNKFYQQYKTNAIHCYDCISIVDNNMDLL